MSKIPFSYPSFAGKEIEYLRAAISDGNIGSNGPFARRCESLIGAKVGIPRVHLTHSATAALELAGPSSICAPATR
jgi:dTDP-4-amino-4,6-dideoxygalactose transaminase